MFGLQSAVCGAAYVHAFLGGVRAASVRMVIMRREWDDLLVVTRAAGCKVCHEQCAKAGSDRDDSHQTLMSRSVNE